MELLQPMQEPAFKQPRGRTGHLLSDPQPVALRVQRAVLRSRSVARHGKQGFKISQPSTEPRCGGGESPGIGLNDNAEVGERIGLFEVEAIARRAAKENKECQQQRDSTPIPEPSISGNARAQTKPKPKRQCRQRKSAIPARE